MKKTTFLTVLLVLFMSIGNVQAEKLNQKEVIRKMAKQIQKDIKRSFIDEDLSLYVGKNEKAKLLVTVRVDRDSHIKVLKTEGESEEFRNWVRSTINNRELKTDSLCKYRVFRFPITFVYKEF
ncbi:hypothetical protein SAMN06265379_10626 [Saccharicrinis carchari]|uniref:TonB protein C-terminal n=1 Tax=Saccharicrinis carchari TaxID=1168039 RepID=A0A521DMG1_SACCC|nr:hypothetical protein [Saccharicrinis carchari]SMO72904.1 hypothetical protein SAMN06265379_10626 [Saccharicrinis carchari]